MKRRSRRANQRSDRVLKRSSLLLQEMKLRARRVEHGLLLCDIEARGDASGVAILYQLQSFFVVRDCFLDVGDLGIEFAQAEVVGGEVGSNQQANIFQIGGGCLILRVRGFYVASDTSKDIGFVIELERNLKNVF